MQKGVSNKKWFALYTRPRFEQKVLIELESKNIETFLPLVKRLKTWSDRKKWVDEPLFRSYVFVNITEKDHFATVQTFGVVKFISFEGKAVVIPENQINAIRMFLKQMPESPEENKHFELGEKVRITSGQLKGLEGELTKLRGRKKVLIMIETVNQKLPVEIPAMFIEKITEKSNG